MKEPEHNIDCIIDTRKKQKKQKIGMSFSTLKQRRRRKLKKKEKLYIEGIGTPSDLQNTCRKNNKGSLNWQLNLKPIEEDREDSETPAPSMAESEQHNSSNQSGSREETKDISILRVRFIVEVK
jgi:hypothetical protein